jgi:hypothetical protein
VDLIGTGDWPKPAGYFYLNRQIFTPYVQAAKEIKNKSPFEFYLSGKMLVVRHGRRRKAKFSTQPTIDGYGQALEAKSLMALTVSDHAKRLINCARNCASIDQLKPESHCVFIHSRNGTTNIMSRNKKVLFRAHTKGDGEQKVIPMPLFLATLLGARQLKEVEWNKGVVVLRFPGGAIWQPVAAKAHEFPRDAILARMKEGEAKPVLFRIETRRLATALQRLGLYLQAMKREDWVLELRGKKGAEEVELFAEIAHSDFLERVAIDGALPQDIKLQWPLDMILPVMDYVGLAHKKLWLEVRLWAVKNRLGQQTKASYVKTGDIQLVVSTKAE